MNIRKNVRRKENVENKKKENRRALKGNIIVICTSCRSVVRCKSCYRLGAHSVVIILSLSTSSSSSSSEVRGVVSSATSRLEKVVCSALLTILLLMFSSPVASFTC